jgi:hypothetical protein
MRPDRSHLLQARLRQPVSEAAPPVLAAQPLAWISTERIELAVDALQWTRPVKVPWWTNPTDEDSASIPLCVRVIRFRGNPG